MRDRRRRLLIATGRLLAAGLVYALLCIAAGRVLIPCPLNALTGLYCPGCGVSRMCLALLRLDFAAAWRANQAIMLLAPAALVIAVRMARRYVRTGTCRPTRAEERMLYAMIAVLILFGIARNVPALQCLRLV